LSPASWAANDYRVFEESAVDELAFISREADLDLAPGQTSAGPAPWGCSLDSDALASQTAQWRALAAAATSVERGSGTARLMLPADPEMIAAVAALCAAETACCPHARFLLEVTAGHVILAMQAPSTTGSRRDHRRDELVSHGRPPGRRQRDQRVRGQGRARGHPQIARGVAQVAIMADSRT
jgi:hypothetical protein